MGPHPSRISGCQRIAKKEAECIALMQVIKEKRMQTRAGEEEK